MIVIPRKLIYFNLFNLLHVKYGILFLVYFAKDVEDWFGYGKLNAFCHIFY